MRHDHENSDAALWIIVGLIFLALVATMGCVVSKPVVNVTNTDAHGRTQTGLDGGMTVVINAGAGVIEKAAMTGDNSTTGTMTVTAESGGGAGGILGTLWAMAREWFGMGGGGE